MLYTIICDDTTSGKLTVSDKTDFFNAFDAGTIQLNAGYKHVSVQLSFESKQENSVLTISSDVLKTLSIPTHLSYQLVPSEEGLRIGPVIGLLMFKNKKNMTQNALDELLNYTLLYNSMRGLVYIFSLDDMYFDTHVIAGYGYNPEKRKWEKGIFPFPDAIFRRVSMPDKTIKMIQDLIGNRMFNSYYFNKLEYWKMASQSAQISEHLPCTRELTSFKDIDDMLVRYHVVYLKPVSGMRAFGLIRATKKGHTYSFQEKLAEHAVSCTTKAEAEKYVEQITQKRAYIIQEGIDLLMFENRYIDFRVIMQKDHTLKWQCTGIITSLGRQGGVCSNYHDGAKYMSFEAFFDTYSNLKKKEVFQKKQEIIEVGKKACKVLDESGRNYADLGIDIGLDRNLKPWVFELNNRCHLHSMSLFINDYDVFYRVKTNPIKYAVKLSGFHIE